MKFQIDQSEFNAAVMNVSHFVSSKSTIPALEGIFIETKDNTVLMTGYDLEIGIFKRLEATVISSGSIVLPAKLFAEIIRKLPDGLITFTVDEKLNCMINCGDMSYDLPGISGDEFPILPDINKQSEYAFPAEMFKSVVRQTIFAVATNDMKPINTGLMFDINDEMLTVVGVDGYRLAVRKEKISGLKDTSFIIPGKAVGEVVKLINDDTENVSLFVGSSHCCFEIDGYTVIARLLEGDFLDYNKAIPKEVKTRIVVNTRKISETIDRISPLISDREKSPVRVKMYDDTFFASCVTQSGKGDGKFDISIDGDDLEIGFNNKYMMDALKAAETDEIVIEFCGGTSPIVIKPTDGDSFLFLVLPVRLKN